MDTPMDESYNGYEQGSLNPVDEKKTELQMLSQLLRHTSGLNQSLATTERNLRELNEGMKMSIMAADKWKTALNLTSLIAQDLSDPSSEGEVVKLVKLDNL
eukprot:CFRG0344T1